MSAPKDRQAKEARFLELLVGARSRDPEAMNALANLVIKDLKAIARTRLAATYGRRLAGITQQPTGVAGDAFLTLLRQQEDFTGLDHFFALASTMVWRSVADHARRRRARRPKNGARLVRLEGDPKAPEEPVMDEDLRLAIEELGRFSPRAREVLEQRKLWGLTIQQVAQATGRSAASVSRDLQLAIAWMRNRLAGSHGVPPSAGKSAQS